MLNRVQGAPARKRQGPLQHSRMHWHQENRVEDDPDERHISTSYIERSNLTMRMHNRRFTRLTNAFSKKFENHAHMVAIYASGTTSFAFTRR